MSCEILTDDDSSGEFPVENRWDSAAVVKQRHHHVLCARQSDDRHGGRLEQDHRHPGEEEGRDRAESFEQVGILTTGLRNHCSELGET